MRLFGRIFPFAFLLFPLLPVSCSSSGPADSYIEDIFEFNLDKSSTTGMDRGLTRSQTAYILYGAMTKKEREEKQGQYYTLHWQDNNPDTPLDLVFDYQQAASGSKILTLKFHFSAGRDGGEVTVPIDFTGDARKQHGRVMTWKATLMDGKRELSRRTSYLWEDPLH